ncbi:MAG TPA: baseplate J/gp47 family protein [Bryobacteraceae bacterium]|jgi:uncharacterized phage protein gp47/JayE|nr:baseplate J/gp47 family protein [Bryobacteraceae bacterium]
MAYIPPYLGSSGLSIPAYADILNDLLGQFQTIYGQNVYMGPDSADYQFISAVALKISDTMQALQLVYNARAPLTAIGADLDSIVKLNGLTRKVASYSTCPVVITGTTGTVITNGVVRDVNGYTWNLPPQVTIQTGGTVTVTATCSTSGNINAAIGQISIIATPTAGWTAVTNTVPASAGQPIETDAQLRARQSLSVALPSRSMLAGTQAGIAAVPGVTRYNILENPTNATDSYGNPPHSITCVVENGTDAAVAQAIYNNRSIGCYTNGTDTVTVTDPYTGATMPISFYRPTYVPIYVTLNVHPLAGYSSSTGAAIQTAVANYLNSLQIGESITISALYGAALSVMPNLSLPMFSIKGLFAGTSPNPTTSLDITLLFYQVASGSIGNISLAMV